MHIFRHFIGALAILTLSACGGGGSSPSTPPPPPAPTISSFVASPVTIASGGSSTLTAVFANGAGVITPGNISVTSGIGVSVSPTSTTTYTITVTNSAQATTNQAVTVTVSASPAITSFVANPSTIAPGGSSTLTAVFANGSGVITPGNISVTSGTGVTVSPASTTVYTLTVTPSIGTPITQSLTLTISQPLPPTVTLFAGNSSGYSGASDGTGSNASFYYPMGICVDKSGNVFVADMQNNTIRKITSAGVVTTVAGLAPQSGSTDGAGNSARFYFPTGVAVDNSGNIYVTDSNNNTVRKISSTGVVATFAGTAGVQGGADGIGAAASFCLSNDLTVASDGSVFVADGLYTVRKIASDATVTTFAGTARNYGSSDGTGAAASFYIPTCLRFDGSGNLFLSEGQNNTVRMISPSAVVTTVAGKAGSPGSTDGQGTNARFQYPEGVAIDASGNVYIADLQNRTVRKMSANGTVTTVLGIQGAGVLADSLPYWFIPRRLAIDPVSGDLYMSCTSSHAILKVHFN